MSRTARDNAVIPFTPAADYSAAKGKLVDLAGEVATLSASATVIAKGVIVEPNDTAAGYAAEKVAVAILGACAGTVSMRCSGVIAKGAAVQQAADGTIVTEGAGARVVVGIALEAGAVGENIDVAAFTPRYYAA